MNHHVVIIGGGFGGLYATQALKHAPVHVTLLDRRNFHLFQPLLYQVATGTLAPGDIASPLRIILKRQKNVEVLLGEASGFNISGKKVILKDGEEIPFDTLIVASGSESNYYGHDDWRSFAPGLKTIEDATAMRSRILRAFESAERETDAEKIRRYLTFIVVGAGPTGVELAGALAEVARETLRDNFRHIRPEQARILLINGRDHVLPGYPTDLSIKAEKALARLGITVRQNANVTHVQSGEITIGEGAQAERIQAQTILWTTGVRASPLGQELIKATGAKADQEGRVLVNSDLSVPGHPEVFIVGDLANPSAQTKQTLPGVAQVAIQEGRYVARLIQKRLQSQSLPPFHYRDFGSLATIGRNAAVADLGWVHFDGFLAWFFWAVIHVFKLLGFENRMLVMIQWAWNYITWRRSDLLITHSADQK